MFSEPQTGNTPLSLDLFQDIPSFLQVSLLEIQPQHFRSVSVASDSPGMILIFSSLSLIISSLLVMESKQDEISVSIFNAVPFNKSLTKVCISGLTWKGTSSIILCWSLFDIRISSSWLLFMVKKS